MEESEHRTLLKDNTQELHRNWIYNWYSVCGLFFFWFFFNLRSKQARKDQACKVDKGKYPIPEGTPQGRGMPLALCYPLYPTPLPSPQMHSRQPACRFPLVYFKAHDSPAIPVWAGADPWPSLSATWFSLIARWIIASTSKWFTPCKAPPAREAYPLLHCREKYFYRATKIMKLIYYFHYK